jgi:drug/metabolite transporter (DMT)-like permease
MKSSLSNRGVQAGLASALLFGASTPLAKPFASDFNPFLVAGLLYVGSGLGLFVLRILRGNLRLELPTSNRASLLGAVFFGGVVAPALLMFGLSAMAASDASLLLNTEAVFTALIAWFVFKENYDRNIALGMLAVVAGAAVLSFSGDSWRSQLLPTLAVLGACLCWGIDNNLTGNVAAADAVSLASIKGLVAGPTNLILAVAVGASMPPARSIVGLLALGFICYGLSLVLFIVALRQLGTARAGAYFCVAPFFGATLAVALGAPFTWRILVAGCLMALGIWLHLIENHEHEHSHGDVDHAHAHSPDITHRHPH